MATRRRLSTEARHAQLLSVGIRIFSERPYDSVSTEEIAEAAGVSTGLLYHYFPSKRHLYVATVQAIATAFEAATTLDPSVPMPQALQRVLDNFLTFIENNSAIYRALIRGGVGVDGEVHAIVERVRQGVVRQLIGVVYPSASPRLRLHVVGWVGFVEASSLDWLIHRDLPREVFLQCLTESLPNLLQGAMT